ncbi:hypothetical protein MNB_ARC-1_39 [hydrothermal vent metagenome]|uniref:Curli production assembly/transport component CsgG n=1 Tax=hydrothermal vent metagenome TaxID=652676 RepID=A0A3B1E926_9ZZZZ
MDIYKYTSPKVAVLNIVNNSTYDEAKVQSSHSSGAIGLGVGITGFVAGVKQSSSSTKRDIKSKLSQSIVPLIETIVLNTGGAQLYTRSELDRINEELKLQESGLLDPKSVVQFGNLSGVQYLITGTINNATADYRNYSTHTNVLKSTVKNTKNTRLKLASSVLSLGVSFLDGTDIKTSITIKMLDVSSGKIIFTTTLHEKIKVSGQSKPTYDQIISGIKNSIENAMPQLENELSKYFKIQGYITKLRRDKENIIGQINIGSDKKIKQGDKFELYSLEESIDPLTNTKSCEKIKLSATANVSNQITNTHSWIMINNIDPNLVKILQLVQKVN